LYIQIFKNYLFGYVRITIEGYFIERLMNLCSNKSILMWNSKREKQTILEVNVGVKDFKKVVKLAKQAKCRVNIKQKKGIPFIFNRYRKRKIFFISLLLIIGVIAVLSNFVWNIEIVGNEKIQKDEILETLQKEGLQIGTVKSKVDTKEIINKMRLDRNDLAWVGVEIKGTNAIVKIVEADQKPEIIKEDEYCNIVAKKAGIIEKISAVNGTPLVQKGDVVKAGTPIIGGWLEGKFTGTRYVHANGSVQAKVWYSENVKIPLKQVVSKETGNEETKYSLRINNFTINFYKTLSKFQKYDTIEQNKKLKLFLDFYLPIEIVQKNNKELVEETINYTKEQARNKAVEEAKSKLEQQVEDKQNILNTYINYEETEEYIEAQVIYEVLEEIGTKEKIVFWKEEMLWKKEV